MNKPVKPLGENAARALGLRTEETSNRDMKADGQTEAGQIGELALIAAVDSAGVRLAEWTLGGWPDRLQENRDRRSAKFATIEAASRWSAEQFKRQQRHPPCLQIQLAVNGQVIAVLRCAIIECAGEP